jgi:ABC-2 type transport system permease protein
LSRNTPIFIIAKKEFVGMFDNQFVILASIALVVFAILNGIGGSTILKSMDAGQSGDVFILTGFGQILVSTMFLFTIIAVFTGAMSIAEERFKHSTDLLLTKPLYRRDVIIGKYIGMNAFLLIYIIFYLLLTSLLILMFFRAPLSVGEYFLRVSTYMFLLFLESSFSMAIAMLFAIIFKDLLKVVLLTVTYLFIDWYSGLSSTVSIYAKVSPSLLVSENVLVMLNTSAPIMDWLNLSVLNITILITGAICISLLGCLVYTKIEDI